jgi:hypothetical protein
MPTPPTLPPVAGTQNAGIHSATGGPALTDLGLIGTFVGGVITSLKTAFPLTQDTYHDGFMNAMVDVVYGQGMEVTFDMEIHNRGATTTGVEPDPGVDPSRQVGSLLDSFAVKVLAENDCRGFKQSGGADPMLGWDGASWIITEAPGTFERQKLRKDSVKLLFRQYTNPGDV